MKKNQEPTMQDVLEAVYELSSNTDAGFRRIETEIVVLKTDVAGLKTDVSFLKSQIVTKAYLDDKLADHYSDIVNHVKKMVPIWLKSSA